ncbi:hypothetical protein FHX49_001033 [Microbacterium endophyticum]|uniref:Alternate-type signal peptide domain-containing protein n=1 Tax=Microbacterium endophyticum TaxID=1526412 RepID=A0A7W4V245_9MICO|nr:hypothetical protein [Microbacterium endophyticum]MBB2975467.1 hypothetical protein [Microbacterium endophyticum]NIK35514.1 hypothetical protein [Microbacterium endophyticum]
MQSVRRGAAVILASGMLVVGLSACGPAPWNQASTASPSPTSTATVVPAPVENDLSSGSTEREVTAGAVSAKINYWSTLSMDQWTATALKPISLSMSTTVTPNDGQKVYLQRAVMVAVPANATETFAALEPQTDKSSVNPGYLVLDPYSYSQTFNMGEVPAGATFVTVQFTYDFLVQAAPDSTEFAKQTATDSLTIAIAGSPVSGTDG